MSRLGIRCAAVALLAILSTGCAMGVVFRHTTVPLTVDYQNTPVMDRGVKSDVRRFRYYVRIDWHKNAIGDVARKAGFTKVHYADIETFSLLGIWTQQYVIVYGN